VSGVLDALCRKPIREIGHESVTRCIDECIEAFERLREAHPGSDPDHVEVRRRLLVEGIGTSVTNAFFAVQARLAARRNGLTPEEMAHRIATQQTAGFPPEQRETMAAQVREGLLSSWPANRFRDDLA
jgi:hypothetical protein